MGIDQEVEFHAIEIQFFMRSKLFSIMRSNFFSNFLSFCKIDQEIELALGALRELG
jgi:hypothetical protein